MTAPAPASIQSFIITIYGSDLKPLALYQLPVNVMAPFANRLFREMVPNWRTTVREPWYGLLPCAQSGSPVRSPLPDGPTSLYGDRYDPQAEPGPQIQMSPEAPMRFCEVFLKDFEKELYRGIYTLDDIFSHGVHHLLRRRAEQDQHISGTGPYYYDVLPSPERVRSKDADELPEDAYKVEGVFRLPPRPKAAPRIQFRPVAEPPLPEHEPSSYGTTQVCGKGKVQAGRVFIPRPLYEDFCRNLVLSKQVEQGGYLLGHVYRQPGSPEQDSDPGFRWLVEVTQLVMTEGTVGSPLMLLFTGDAWSSMTRIRDRDFPDHQLTGWFHTHLFPASDSFGLSGLDQDMHAWYLSRPWQVAVLLNLERSGEHSVRCYQRGPQGSLVETQFEIFDPPSTNT